MFLYTSLALKSYDLSKNTQTGSELKDLILDEDKQIILTLWYKHEQNSKEHNKRNLITEGSIKKLLSNCHQQVIYTEADISDYNKHKDSFLQAAKEWDLNLSELDEGPLVMIMHKQEGDMFWVTRDTLLLKLVRRVDKYIMDIKKEASGAGKRLLEVFNSFRAKF